MLDEFEEWNLIMSHYFGLLSVTYNQKGEQYPKFKELMDSVKLKLWLSHNDEIQFKIIFKIVKQISTKMNHLPGAQRENEKAEAR